MGANWRAECCCFSDLSFFLWTKHSSSNIWNTSHYGSWHEYIPFKELVKEPNFISCFHDFSYISVLFDDWAEHVSPEWKWTLKLKKKLKNDRFTTVVEERFLTEWILVQIHMNFLRDFLFHMNEDWALYLNQPVISSHCHQPFEHY